MIYAIVARRCLLALGYSMKDIQEWLGHSNYQTTANLYSHVDPRNKNKMIRGLSSALDASGK
jgi:integrase